MDLCSELIKDYDRKVKELIEENSDVKSFIAHVITSLSSLSQKMQYSKILDDNCLIETEIFPDQVSDLIEEVSRLSFDAVQAKVYKDFQSNIDLIKEKLEHLSPNQSDINNITISSIGSTTSTLTKISHKNSIEDMVNTTFIINSKDEEYDTELTKSHTRNFESDFSEAKKSIESQNEFNNYSKNSNKNISSILSISSPSVSSSSSLMSASPKNQNKIKISCDLLDKDLIFSNDDRAKLNLEKKLFYEQKIKFEQDAILLKKISAELNKQVRYLHFGSFKKFFA